MQVKKNSFILLFMIVFHGITFAQLHDSIKANLPVVNELDNSIFRDDSFWQGADGAATIDLDNGRVLWLFSDTFIDSKGKGKRSNAKMINNSIAIQGGYEPEDSQLTFYYKGSRKKPKSFFELPGDTWFWIGHGTVIKDKLVVFLFEEKSVSGKGIGFESIGWYMVIINNPDDNPANWKMKYVKGSDTFGVIVGSSAVLKDRNFLYAYGVKEPATHEVYLLRFGINKLVNGNIDEIEWWVNGNWESGLVREPESSSLFIGQTEFSVHYQQNLNKYIQIQTYGLGKASLGYRLSDRLEGPWSEPVIFFKPELKDEQEFVYSANAHPELKTDDIVVTYNVNNGDFLKLITDESIYFPKIIRIKF